jgi:hypothetical protein
MTLPQGNRSQGTGCLPLWQRGIEGDSRHVPGIKNVADVSIPLMTVFSGL